MSAAGSCDCACPTPEIVQVPGVSGAAGAAGAEGSPGIGPFTLLTDDATFADAVATVQVDVALNTGFAIGQTVFAADPSGGTDHGTFEVISKTGTTVIGLRYTAAPGDTAAPFTIGSGGILTATGATGALAAALPAAFTDNSTGTASNTIAAGVGVFTLALQVDLATLTAAASELLTNYVLGYAFKILSVDFVVGEVGAGAGATMTINLEIGVTNVTGGVVNPTLANTATQGVIVSGTAVTAANVGTAANTLSVEVAAGGTIFTAGEGSLLIKIQNMDQANSGASMAAHINALIVALT